MATQGDRQPLAGAQSTVRLALCGDVMVGRGIDQILAHPSRPHLFEQYMRSAAEYIELAEQVTGPIPRPVEDRYVWGDSLEELDRLCPDVRIINLETAVTTAETAWPGKGINYRMHPANIGCLVSARVDCCVLANNHVLDWGRAGLSETLLALHAAGIRTAGAGSSRDEATAPAELAVTSGKRVLVFAYGTPSSGVQPSWAAGAHRSGVSFLPELSARAAASIARRVSAVRREGDVVVVSLHWGDNWGYAIGQDEQAFARRLIDAGAADVVHGHSSHHPRGIEVHRGKLVLYGCGDLLNDYEGIEGHERFRPELCALYLATLDTASGRLVDLTLSPLRLCHFRLERASLDEARWLERTFGALGERLGTGVRLGEDGALRLVWGQLSP